MGDLHFYKVRHLPTVASFTVLPAGNDADQIERPLRRSTSSSPFLVCVLFYSSSSSFDEMGERKEEKAFK